MRIAFAGGGTGGHVTPIIAVAREIRRLAEEGRILDVELFYFGPENIPAEAKEREEIIFSHIPAGKIRRYFSFLNLTDILKTILGAMIALWKMFIVMPDVVFAKGGYASFPALLAARLYRLPVIVHSSDAVPGAVEKWAGRWARRTAVSFPAAVKFFPEDKTALIGIPLRKGILGGSENEAREALGVFSKRPVLLIVGGSQGAEVINQTIVQILKELVGQYEIIHQSGEKNYEDVRLETSVIVEGENTAYYHLLPFLSEDKLRSAYFLADLVISRAGATFIYEIAARGKPSILIPIKNSAQDHQRENAYQYAARGGAVVIEQDNLTPSVLLNEIQRLMADPARRQKMAEAAKGFARLDAAEIIAKEILTLGLH